MGSLESIFHNHVGIFHNSVSDSYCDTLVNIFKDSLKTTDPKKNRNFIDGGAGIIVKDTAISVFSPNIKEIKYFLNEVLHKTILPLYLNKYSGYQDLFLTHNPTPDGFNIQQTLPGQGYHKWHSEWYPEPDSINRSLVWTLYLNNIEEGGETEFLDIPFRVKPQKGTICIFPSAPTHYHRGNPPLKTAKYIATGWIKTYPYPNNPS